MLIQEVILSFLDAPEAIFEDFDGERVAFTRKSNIELQVYNKHRSDSFAKMGEFYWAEVPPKLRERTGSVFSSSESFTCPRGLSCTAFTLTANERKTLRVGHNSILRQEMQLFSFLLPM